MATSASVTNNANLLKSLWGNQVADPLYKMSKFAAAVKKDTKFTGDGRYVVVTVAPTAGGSSDFDQALANQAPTTEVRFFVTHKTEYQIASIDGSAIAQSEGDKGAMLSIVKQQVDKKRYSFGRAMAARMWGTGEGILGTIASTTTISTTSCDLTIPSEVVHFEKGMVCQFATIGTGLVSANTLTVSSLNRTSTTDQIVFSAALNTIPSMATGLGIVRAGDYGNVMTGMPGWCPVSDPAATAFFGVDRTATDMSRVSGIRYTAGSGGSKEEILIDAAAEGSINASGATMVSVHPKDFAGILKEVGSKRIIDVKTRNAPISFRGLMLESPMGEMTVVSEPDVPKGYFWIYDPEYITLRTAGDCPRMLNWAGGGMFIPSSNRDGMQARIGAYGNLFVENPGDVIVGTW